MRHRRSDVRLDIGAMKGQALIAQRKWAEAEAILDDTIERATSAATAITRPSRS